MAIIDHETAGTAVVSSGFFNGFSQEARGMALIIMLLLFTGIIGSFVSSRVIGGSFLAAETVQSGPNNTIPCVSPQGQSGSEACKLAQAYYAKKYNDANVNIDVMPRGDHMEADVRKEGVLVKRLSIRGSSVTENRTGAREWAFSLLTNVN